MPGAAGKDATDSTAREPDPQPQQRKRRRISYACDHCRAKKNRCDGERPTCSPCKSRQLACVYAVQKPRSSVTQEYVDNLKARNHMLEQQLAAQSSNPRDLSSSPYSGALSSTSQPIPNQEVDRQNGFIQPSPGQRSFNSTIHPASFPHQPQPDRLTPGHLGRESNSNSAYFGASMNSAIQGVRPNGLRKLSDRSTPSNPAEGSGEYFGESSTFDFMAKVSSPLEDDQKPHSALARRPGPGPVDAALAMATPSDPMFEGLVLGHGGEDPFVLPQRYVADKLVNTYFEFRHPLNTYLHEPSFRTRFARLWMSEEVGGEQATEANLAWIGLVNLVFMFGSAYPQAISRGAAVDRHRFYKRARTLVFSGLLQTGSIDLVQALLLMGRFLHTSLELNTCWTVVGLAIRMAQGLGLHLDASTFTSDPVEQEIRKRVWWGCFVQDRLLSMKVGRPPTIHDGPSITVGLPLAVDDEYLTHDESKPPTQPPNTPSTLDFLLQIIQQCQLVERICDVLYTRHLSDSNPKQKLTDVPKLLSRAVELDGELVAWQEALPAHLTATSQYPGWHFERQRSTLVMRFLNSRLLLHRQVLLVYVTRKITDSFQLEIMYCCVQRCIIAAFDTINQMRMLRQRQLMSSMWHNSHYVFTALGVMLAFQALDEKSKQDVRLPESIDVDQVIVQGTELLEEVGGQLHPIAARYLESLRRMQAKLKTIRASRDKHLERPPPTADLQSEDALPQKTEQNPTRFSGTTADDFGESFQQLGDTQMTFGEDFSEIENMFYNTGWFGQVDWAETYQ